MFWSSDKLTGSQTRAQKAPAEQGFWSSDKLTGDQPWRPSRTTGGRVDFSIAQGLFQRFQLVSLRWGFFGIDLRMLTERTAFADDRCDRQATR